MELRGRDQLSKEFRMKRNSAWLVTNAALLLLGSGIFANATRAQTPSDDWQFDAVLYAYIPQIRGSTTFATGTTSNITLDPNQYLSSLNFAASGVFEARKGSLGVFTDIMYMSASGSKSATRDLSISGITIPASVSADAHFSVKSTVWTLAGEYRAVSAPQWTLDLLIGTRALFLDQHLSWNFSADIGPFVGPGRQGSSASNPNNWDGIIGAKGRWMFGDDHRWYLPYYLDVGTGASQLTWQAYGGVGYAFSWGEVVGVWRYLDWHFSAHSSSFALNGPAIGVVFRW
jgi:hypothetical protein